MSFCTVVNCMDGRVQLPVIEYLMKRLGVEYVDSVTEAGPVGRLSSDPDGVVSASIISRVGVSVERHGSRVVAVVAHHDCGGNPIDEDSQREQLAASIDLIARRFPQVSVAGLWVDADWRVTEVDDK